MSKLDKTIHYRQLISLQFLCILSTGLILPPSTMIKDAGPGVWISGGPIGTLTGILVSIIILLLAKKFPDKDPIEISGLIFGKIGRFIFGLLFTFLFMEIAFLALRELGEFIKDLILPRTPLFVILFFTIFVSIYAVRSGLEVLGRMADFIMPITIISLLLILLYIVRAAELKSFTPILDKGWEGIFRGSIGPSLWYSEIFLGAMFLPAIKQKNKKAACFFIPLFTTGGMVVITIMIAMGVLGGEMAGRLEFPVFSAASMGRASLFVQMDVFVAAIWILGITFKISVFHYAAALSLQKTFQVHSYKPFVLPIALLLGLFAYTLFKSDIDLIEFFTLPKITAINILFFTLILPLLLLLSSFIRKAKK